MSGGALELDSAGRTACWTPGYEFLAGQGCPVSLGLCTLHILESISTTHIDQHRPQFRVKDNDEKSQNSQNYENAMEKEFVSNYVP